MKTASTTLVLFALALVLAADAAFARRGAGDGGRPQRDRLEWSDPDTDNNCIIDSGEASAAIARVADHMREHFEDRNERVLENFDDDGDGKLTGEELERAQKIREHMLERREERRDRRCERMEKMRKNR